MKPKKYANKNLNRLKTLFFQCGLIAALTLILILVEWKTEAKSSSTKETVSYFMLEDEEMPRLKLPEEQLDPIPEPKPDIDDFIIDDEVPEPKEDLSEPKESTQDAAPLDLDDIEDVKEYPIKEMSFDVIEDVPIFPGCEIYLDNKDRKTCMSEQLRAFINKEFDSGLAADLGLKGVNRIYTTFKIKANGEVDFINARAPHPRLKKESQRVIEKLPNMQPGKQRGNPVDVIFSLPITFKVSN